MAEDFTLSLGLDTTKAEKAILKVERLLSKIDSVGSGKRSSTKQVTAGSVKKTKEMSKQNTLESQRLSLLKKINKAEKLGLATKGFKNSLRGKDPVKVRSRALELEKQITQEVKRRDNLPIPKKVVAAKAAPAAKRGPFVGPAAPDFAAINNRRVKALQQVEAAERRVASSFKAGSAEANGFNEQLKRMKVNIARATSKTNFTDVAGKLRVVREEITKTNAAMRKGSFAANGLASSMKHMARSFASVFVILEGGRSFFTIGKEMDSLRASMLAGAGSVEVAGENLEFLRTTANNLGQDFLKSSQGFNRIALAAKGAGMSVEDAREIFLAASESATAFSLDTMRSGNVMLALSQMMSKGKVSMEEMSRQLGESLPTAFLAMERATGKSRRELIKLIESGKLLADKKLMTSFAGELRALAREGGALEAATKKVRAEQNRMNNTWTEAVDLMFQGGGADIFKSAFVAITDVIKGLVPVLTVLGGALSLILKLIGLLLWPVDQLAKLLGFSGGGLGVVINLLASILIGKLATALGATIAALFQTQVASLMAAASLTSTGVGATAAAGGMTLFTRSLIIAKAAARSLLVALGPIGIAFAALSFGADLFVGNGIGEKSGPNSSASNTTNTSNRNVSNSNVKNDITVNTSANPDDVVRVIEDYNQAQMSVAPSL